MIVGCYTLDLYCDSCLKPNYRDGEQTDFGQFVGKSDAECRRLARIAGWSFTRDGRVRCPDCVVSGRRCKPVDL